MPLALDCETSLDRPTKRRKLVEESYMAKRIDSEGESPQSVPTQHDMQPEAGCDISTSPQDYPRSDPPSRPRLQTSDRDELIQCIKRGQRPTWVPKPGLKALYAEEEALQGKRDARSDVDTPTSPRSRNFQLEHDLLFGPWTGGHEPIESPRSVLSTGYFDDDLHSKPERSPTEPSSQNFLAHESICPLSDSPPSWSDSLPYAPIGRAISETQNVQAILPKRPNRSRAPSLSSSFVMRVPTSPLVNAVRNPNLDFSPRSDLINIHDTDNKSRQRTMPPSSFQSYSSVSTDATPNFSRPLSHLQSRRGSSMSFQSHHPRRSIGSFTLPAVPGIQTSMSQDRRFSLTDGSPKRRTSMVGSFEESILRGRMSSPASKPFDFVAQIGVMGKGDCHASLKCPAHVNVPFQAVFYSYPSAQHLRSIADDAPSPYVGTIDVEHNLKTVQLATKRRRTTIASVGAESEGATPLSSSDPRDPQNTPIGKALAREARIQQQEQQTSRPADRINLGGAYRIPQQGQLQIIIKNSNKTAVKLFLVPYDLNGMEPGTKTFIRQRSYSSGPIVEGAISESSQRPDSLDPLKDKNILRYLIHIKFCCPSKGKFYLYDNIRVVFANRIPDGKEKLRNEVQLPEPKYSPWKPSKTPQRSASSFGLESSPISPNSRHASSPGIFEDMHIMKLRDTSSIPEDASSKAESKTSSHLGAMFDRSRSTSEIPSGPGRSLFAFSDIATRDESELRPERALSSVQGFYASTSPRSSPIPWGSSSSSTIRSFSPAPAEAGTGLLSRKFKELHGLSNYSTPETPSDPWGATVSLTRILSQTEPVPRTDDKGGDDEMF